MDKIKNLVKEKLCKKGEAYRKQRMAAGEKSSAYLSGRAVKVCKGQMSGKKKKTNENKLISPSKVIALNDKRAEAVTAAIVKEFGIKEELRLKGVIRTALSDFMFDDINESINEGHGLSQSDIDILKRGFNAFFVAAPKYGEMDDFKKVIKFILKSNILQDKTKDLSKDKVKESLRDWFKKENWVRINTSGNISGDCGTMKKGKATTRCLPKNKAQSMTKAERKATVAKKVRGSKKGKQFVSVNESIHPYENKDNIRTFSKDVDPTSLVWHSDKEDRLIEVLEGEGWKLQLDNKLPLLLSKGDRIFINEGEIHRVHKGTTDLKIKING